MPPDHVRRDIIFAKASGFNCVRFIAGVAWPEQLDFCDEIGMLVYEECYAAWQLGDSPRGESPSHRCGRLISGTPARAATYTSGKATISVGACRTKAGRVLKSKSLSDSVLNWHVQSVEASGHISAKNLIFSTIW